MTPDAVALEICRRSGYELVGPVGTGAFKFTYHVRTGAASVALKLYKHGVSERSAREIEAMRKCDHPHIAKLLALDEVVIDGNQFVYLLEEYLAGGSLASRIGTMTGQKIVRIAHRLSHALEHIAHHQLVHRDIKPDNIMFRDESNDAPVIVDFGLVRDLSAVSLTATHAAQGPGTMYFSAPEQLNNEKAMVAARTDQFGLGVTLAVALFQEHPYSRPGESVLQTLERVANWQQPAREFSEACVAAGLQPLLRMVQPYPVDRFRTPSELVDAWQKKVAP